METMNLNNVMYNQIYGSQGTTLKVLANKVAKPGCLFLEIGSWCGQSSVILGKVAQQNNGLLFCVDWWNGSENTQLDSLAKENDIYQLFWNRIVGEGLKDVVIPIRGSSLVVHQILRPNTFDFIFIDGDHRYSVVKKDIEACQELVKSGGTLSGHDCEGYMKNYDREFLERNKENDYVYDTHCGVVLAVGESFKEYSIDNAIWSVIDDKKM